MLGCSESMDLPGSAEVADVSRVRARRQVGLGQAYCFARAAVVRIGTKLPLSPRMPQMPVSTAAKHWITICVREDGASVAQVGPCGSMRVAGRQRASAGGIENGCCTAFR